MSVMKKYGRKFEIFKALLAKEDPVIVEIGAHFGEDSMRFCEVFKNATLHCIEPDPRCAKIFKKHVKNSNVKFYEIALSSENGRMKFYQSHHPDQIKTPEKYDWITDSDYENYRLGNSGSSSLKKGYRHLLSESIEVEVARFDTWANQNKIDKIDLAWIDVQGAERGVLLGMGQDINKIKHIWIEYGEKDYEDAMSREQTMSLIKSKGYELIDSISSFSECGDLMFRKLGQEV